MKNVLLVSPDFSSDDKNAKTLQFRNPGKRGLPVMSTRALMVPLGLATVAALTPEHISVDIWDEAIHGLIGDNTKFKKDYDVVGVGGYAAHIRRARELGQLFRRRDILVTVGGSGVASSPEHYRDCFDVLFIGEAENTWPQFIADWESGNFRPEYRQVGRVEMTRSPLPRWDKIAKDLKYYRYGGVQTTRGCPFDCDFCDVIYIHGRQPRHKSIAQVLEEVRALVELGTSQIFFCDDNFIGDPRYAKLLLKELIPLTQSFDNPIEFFTQVSLSVAQYDEILELLADANFSGLFIGIETPNIDSLIATNKAHNCISDIVQAVKKTQSYGLVIQAGMIVGFDQDDINIFDQQFEFLQEAGIANPMLNTLKAPPGTKLWVRLHKEGRLVQLGDPTSTNGFDRKLGAGFDPFTNIIPQKMTRQQLMHGYRNLLERVRDWRNFEARVKIMISQVRRKPNVRRRRFSWKWIRSFPQIVLFLITNKEARRASRHLLTYTLVRAPFMMGRVMGLIGRQWMDRKNLPSILKTIDEQIRKENTKELHREQRLFFIPESFKKPYKGMFEEMYNRVYERLHDKSRTPNALVEVLHDFLTRWGPSFQRFEGYHREFLSEISDRTIAKENKYYESAVDIEMKAGEITSGFTGLTSRQAPQNLDRLANEVLRNVEQEMRTFRPNIPHSEFNSLSGGNASVH